MLSSLIPPLNFMHTEWLSQHHPSVTSGEGQKQLSKSNLCHPLGIYSNSLRGSIYISIPTQIPIEFSLVPAGFWYP